MTAEEWKRSWRPWLRGAAIGFPLGALPAGGAELPTLMSYAIEKRLSKRPQDFGRGAIEAVAGPEAANNASAAGTLVPLLTLGLPTSATAAVLLAAFQQFGLQPGPLLFEKHPDFIYGLFGGLFVANTSLFFIGMLILTPAIWLVNRPKPYLLAAIYALIFSGIYSIDHSLFDLYLVLLAGLLGYVMRLFGFPFLPLVLGLVLGYLIEANYRRSLLLTGGDHIVFLRDPIALGLLVAALLFVVGSAWRDIRTARRKAAAAQNGGGEAAA
jgi:putative tricarboxylic transport membrane protein